VGLFLKYVKDCWQFQPVSKIILGQTQAIFQCLDHLGLLLVVMVVRLAWILILKETIYHRTFLITTQGVIQVMLVPLDLDSFLNKR
jgi:hypothetical protein